MSVYPRHVTHVSLQLYTQLCLQELMRWLSWLKVLAAKPGDPCSVPGTYVFAGENFLLRLSSNSHMHIVSHSHAQMSTYISLSSCTVRIAIRKLWHFTLDFTLFIIYHPNQKVCDRLKTRKTVQSGLELTLYPRMASNLQSYCLCSEPIMPEINTMCLFTVLELVN